MDTAVYRRLLSENGFDVVTGPNGFSATAKVIALIACVTLEFKLRYSLNEDRIVMTGRRDDGETREVEWPLAEVDDAVFMAVDTKFRAERS